MTLQQFLTHFAPLIPMQEHQENRGRRLFHDGKPYSDCRTETERDAWIAEWNDALADRETEIEMELA